MHPGPAPQIAAAALILSLAINACTTHQKPAAPNAMTNAEKPAHNDNQPPDHIRAWMQRLTVPHHYDPDTGFIVADRTVPLPPVLDSAPPLATAAKAAEERGITLIAFATADRCAPCQQYKLDAINDTRVISALRNATRQGRIVAAHVEVDREPDEAKRILGSHAIPMTYAISNGTVTATLRGQRPADELLDFINEHTQQHPR